MKVKNTPIDVGVIVGRFQVHELHEAHKDLINTVRSKHERVIIFVGLSPLRNTSTNPLDFNTRKRMIQEVYPDVEVYYVEDNPSDVVWSKILDRELSKWLKPYQTAILYGSRDSFLSSYSGNFPTQELESNKYISGTEIRRRIANGFQPTVEFRAGMIAGSMNRYPTCYPTVDVAIVDWKSRKLLLGKKDNEPHLRFIGGFASPDSPSYEMDGIREVKEETGVDVENLQYIGSTIIQDWRYKKETDKIKTLFYVGTYTNGRPVANDDIQYIEWVDISDIEENKINIMSEHKPLVNMFIKYINSMKN